LAPDLLPRFVPRFVDVGGRLVHYARGGAGPAVAMLHGSPQSHRALLPLARRLAERFTVFAFDTPGYGASDPLPGTPGIGAFGDALAETLHALGLGPVPVYGTHTGASIALEAANRHPRTVSRAVLDGFALFTPAERDDLLARHLPPLRTEWDGSHMAALWSRVRDQGVFFPWFRHEDEARRGGDPAGVAAQHRAVLDLFHAGPHYATAYGASIAHDHAALYVAPERVRLFCRTSDVLVGHLRRLPPGFPPGHARAIGPADDMAISEALAEALSCAAPVAAEPRRRSYAAGLHVRRLGSGPPLLLLHDLPGSGHTVLALAEVLAEDRTVVVPDLPGCGLSPPLPGQDDPDTVARLLAAACGTGDGPGLDIAGVGLGALLAPLVAGFLDAGRVALIDPPPPGPGFAAAYPVDVAPRWDGAHLLTAWFRQRDALLFRPWFDRRAAAALPLGTPDLSALQDRVTAMLEARGPDLAPALLRHPSRPCPIPFQVFSSAEGDAITHFLQPARAAAPCA